MAPRSLLFGLPDEILVSMTTDLDVKSLQNLAVAGIETVRGKKRNSSYSKVSDIARETLRERHHILYIEPNNTSIQHARLVCASEQHAKHITELRWVATMHQLTAQDVVSSPSARYMCTDVPSCVLSTTFQKHEVLRLEQKHLLNGGNFDRELRGCIRALPNLGKITIMTDPAMEVNFPSNGTNECTKARPCYYIKATGAYNRPRYWQHALPPMSVEGKLDQSAEEYMADDLLYNLHYGPREQGWTFDDPMRLFRAIAAAWKLVEVELVFAGHLDLLTEQRLKSCRDEDPAVYRKVMDMITAVTVQLDNARYPYRPNADSKRALPWIQFLMDSNVEKLVVRGVSRAHEEFLNRLVMAFNGKRRLKKLVDLTLWFPDRWYYASDRSVELDSLLSLQPYAPIHLWHFLQAHKSTLRKIVLFNSTGCDAGTRCHRADDLRQLLKRMKAQLQLTHATITVTLSVWFDILDVRAMADAASASRARAIGVQIPSHAVLPESNLGSIYPPPFWNLRPLPQARDRARAADSDLGRLALRLGLQRPKEYHAHRCARYFQLDGQTITVYMWAADEREDRMYYDFDFGPAVLGDDDFGANTDPESEDDDDDMEEEDGYDGVDADEMVED